MGYEITLRTLSQDGKNIRVMSIIRENIEVYVTLCIQVVAMKTSMLTFIFLNLDTSCTIKSFVCCNL